MDKMETYKPVLDVYFLLVLAQESTRLAIRAYQNLNFHHQDL